MAKPTPAAIKVIDALHELGAGWHRPAEVAAKCGQGVEGVALTVGAAVRHGWIDRAKYAGRVEYRLTDAGRRIAQGRVR